jgi:prepilin-type N-terminal cleavage/methylation domain-containing protein
MPCAEAPRTPAATSRGFTLLEVVVVLVIVSLTSAIVFPRLTTMVASYAFATERDGFEYALSGLPYQAYKENTDKILHGLYTSAGRDEARRSRRDGAAEIPAYMRTRPLIDQSREHLPPVNPTYVEMPLPEGWEVVVEEPIYYRGSGYCSGGIVRLHVGRLLYNYALKPPSCRAELME